MDINSILKTGGKVNVLIRTKYAQQIGDKYLEANEPYTFLENIPVYFYVNHEHSNSIAQGTWINYDKSDPNIIVLDNVPLSKKICNLIFQERKNLYKNYYFETTALNNQIILHHNEGINLFIYDENNNKVLSVSGFDNNIITSDYFIDNNLYKIFYDYQVTEGQQYNLSSPNRMYFSLDVYGVGNSDNVSNNIYIKIDKCSLITDNSLSFNEGLNDVKLSFYIIREEKDKNKDKNYFIIE